MHVFLTGQLHSGKSTAIARAIELIRPRAIGGFRTVSRPTLLPGALAEVYILPTAVSVPEPLDRDHLIGIRWGDDMYTPFPAAFEQGGVKALSQPPPQAELLLMDELGRMESQAPAFRRLTLELLNGPLPVLGVVQQQALSCWEPLLCHPQVKLLEVSAANRDMLPEQIYTILLNKEPP